MKTPKKKLDERLAMLKRRRDFLAKRISDYKGKNDSFDRSEYYSTKMAVGFIEANYELALEYVASEQYESIKEEK